MRSFHQGEGRLFYDSPLNDIVDCDYCLEKIKPDEDYKESFYDEDRIVCFYHEECSQHVRINP